MVKAQCAAAPPGDVLKIALSVCGESVAPPAVQVLLLKFRCESVIG